MPQTVQVARDGDTGGKPTLKERRERWALGISSLSLLVSSVNVAGYIYFASRNEPARPHLFIGNVRLLDNKQTCVTGFIVTIDNTGGAETSVTNVGLTTPLSDPKIDALGFYQELDLAVNFDASTHLPQPVAGGDEVSVRFTRFHAAQDPATAACGNRRPQPNSILPSLTLEVVVSSTNAGTVQTIVNAY